MTASTYRATVLSCVALLALLGCLSCAEVRGDTMDGLGLNEQLVNGAERIGQETCQSDIHAVLREMSALTAELRTELRHTQQELKAAVDRLQDSERLVKALQVEQQEHRAVMERLVASDSLIKASVETVEARSNVTHHEVQLLQKLNEVRQVSFSASLLASGNGYTGPYNVETTLKYRLVFTNVGNGYNPETGLFSAPVRGIYHFTVFIHGHGGNSPSGAALVKNGQRIATAYEHQPSHSYTTSNGASLLLEAGDVVCVKLFANARIWDSQNHDTTFMGHLLFAL